MTPPILKLIDHIQPSNILEAKDIELRSEEVRDILSHIPNWLTRWGITAVFFVMASFVLVATFIQYPDVVVARIAITTQTLPALIKAKQGGKVSHLLVKENQFVKKGELLGIINNAANYQDMEKVKRQLVSFNRLLLSQDSLIDVTPEKNVNLGELQGDYTQMWRSYQDYEFFIRNNFYQGKIMRLEQQLATYRELLPRLEAQNDLLAREFELVKKKYETDRTLLQGKAIAQMEFDNTEKEFLRSKYSLENMQMEVLRSNIQVQNYQKEILDIQTQFSENRMRLMSQLRQTIMNFDAELALWEDTYLFRSPIDGYVSFFKLLAEQQLVNAGEEVMTIVPVSKEIFGYAYLPSQGSGEVEEGQEVKIRFEGYEFKEFGSVRGVVASKGNIAKNGQYLVKISLPNGLMTNYRRKLDFSQDMQGEAHIVTKDLRLIERIFYQFKHLFVD